MNKKQRLIAIIAFTFIFILSVVLLAACTEPDDLTFAQREYTVKDGDYVTVTQGSAQYKLLGSIPDGVSVSEDGQFHIAATATNGAQVVLAATVDGNVVDTTICKISVALAAPEITFANLSEYITDGEQVRAISTPAYSITYSLKEDVNGVVIDEITGRVSYRGAVADSIQFTVIASAMGVSAERTFLTATANFVTVENTEEFSEYGVGNDVRFIIDFGNNASAEAMGIIDVEVASTHLTESQYSYDSATHTLTIDKAFLATLSSGENEVRITTAKNTAIATVKVARFVRTAEDLAAIGQSKEALSAYYVMVNDIDLTQYLSDKEFGWYPIGTYSESDAGVPNTENVFSGHFDGNGYTVSGLVINRHSYWEGDTIVTFTEAWNCGLFGYVSSNGIIENLGVVSAVDGASLMCSYSGGLCGVNEGTITNCWANVNVVLVDEHRVAGGFCGRNSGTISNCFSIGFATVGSDLGAFCGWNMGEIIDCYAVDDPENAYRLAHENFVYDDPARFSKPRPDVLDFVGLVANGSSVTRCAVFTSVSEMIAGADFSNWNGWTVDGNGLPTLKSKAIG